MSVLRKHVILVLTLIFGGLAVAVSASLLIAPTFSAQTQIVISAQQTGTASTDELLQGSSYSRSQVTTYVQLVRQPVVLDPVIKGLALNTTAEQLAKEISATNPVNTTIIDITASWGDARTAADIANATAESMATVIKEMETPEGSSTTRVKVTTTSSAEVPASPATPNLPLNLALGLALGIAAGIAAAVLREVLDVRIKEPGDIDKLTSSSVIGLVPETNSRDADPLVLDGATASPRAEAFRKLRTNLRFVDIENAPKSIVITSSIPGEAKTTTSINLAYAIAASGLRVCLVEADLRRPRLASYLGLEGSIGLTSVLIGQVNLAGALQRFGGVSTLHVMTCGQIPPNPAEWLGSATMGRLIHTLEQQYDMVILDSPPLLPVTDAAVLSGMVGGTLLVVGSGKVNQAELERSLQSLKTVDARLLGIVMTFLKTRRMGAYGASYSYTYDSIDAGA